MKRVRVSNTKVSRRNRGRVVISAIYILIGLLLFAPFIIDIIVLGSHYHHITLFPLLEILGLVVGGPMFFMGLMSSNNSYVAKVSTNDMDVQRIRIAAEAEMMRKK